MNNSFCRKKKKIMRSLPFPPTSQAEDRKLVTPSLTALSVLIVFHLFGPEHGSLSGLGGNMDSMLSIKPVYILNDSLPCSIQKRLMRQISSLSAALHVCVPCWNHEKLQGRTNKNWLKQTRSLFFFICAWKICWYITLHFISKRNNLGCIKYPDYYYFFLWVSCILNLKCRSIFFPRYFNNNYTFS